MELILLILYIYFGDKSIQFLKRNILHIETVIVFSVVNWLKSRFLWTLLFGWIAIPIAGVMYLIGFRD